MSTFARINHSNPRVEILDRLNHLKMLKQQLKTENAPRHKIIAINRSIAHKESHLAEMEARDGIWEK